MVRVSVIVVFEFFLFALTSGYNSVFAVTLKIVDVPSTIETEDFTVKFLVTGAKPATNYFRVLLYTEGARTYLAQTWNGSSWYDGSDGKTYFPLSVSTATSSGEIKAKIKQGVVSGNYMISLKRYTASGSSADDEVSPRSVFIKRTVADPQVTKVQDSPLPSPTQEPSDHPSPTPVTKSEFETPSRKLEVTPEPTAELTEQVVLSATSSGTQNHQQADTAQDLQGPNIAGIAIGIVGIFVTFIGGYRFFSEYKRWYTERIDES